MAIAVIQAREEGGVDQGGSNLVRRGGLIEAPLCRQG